ncbi:hypothetical protein PENDEC_c010G00709 [Penicillium decumbens]|uniref:Uncharacterized protein n=1 Tax=Penicillium decumbens TaxID=69771 RepID=A0A1V6PBW3_PENDC|nr:hypothetical protein PENDEC_c010G00709 [Penicillium decumbens]
MGIASQPINPAVREERLKREYLTRDGEKHVVTTVTEQAHIILFPIAA